MCRPQNETGGTRTWRAQIDLHRLFDAGAWVPMVKENRMVVHVLRNSVVTNQFIQIFHNQEMQELIGIDKNVSSLVSRTVFSLYFSTFLPLDG